MTAWPKECRSKWSTSSTRVQSTLLILQDKRILGQKDTLFRPKMGGIASCIPRPEDPGIRGISRTVGVKVTRRTSCKSSGGRSPIPTSSVRAILSAGLSLYEREIVATFLGLCSYAETHGKHTKHTSAQRQDPLDRFRSRLFLPKHHHQRTVYATGH